MSLASFNTKIPTTTIWTWMNEKLNIKKLPSFLILFYFFESVRRLLSRIDFRRQFNTRVSHLRDLLWTSLSFLICLFSVLSTLGFLSFIFIFIYSAVTRDHFMCAYRQIHTDKSLQRITNKLLKNIIQIWIRKPKVMRGFLFLYFIILVCFGKTCHSHKIKINTHIIA